MLDGPEASGANRASPRRVEILMVDDDAADVALTQDILADHRVSNRFSVVDDGIKALRYLRREPPFADAPRPDIVLLDLNLPGIDGLTVLSLIREDPTLWDLPVAVLTTAPVDEHILRSRGVPAACYVRKPVDFDRLVEIVQHVDGLYLLVERRG